MGHMSDFPEHSRFLIYCGTHGARDGDLGHTSMGDIGDMLQQYRSMVSFLTTYDKRSMEIIEERDFRFDVKHIGDIKCYTRHEAHLHDMKNTMHDMLKNEDPYVIILAFCFTH